MHIFKRLIQKAIRWTEKNSILLSGISSLIQIVIFPTILLTVILAYFQIGNYIKEPDLHIKFHRPNELVYTITNNGKAVAEKPFYWFALLDLDSNPLKYVPIPSQEISYIKPNSTKGPQQLMSKYGEKGHRYFGYAGITCINGDKDRNYWLYFQHGNNEEAWVMEQGEGVPKQWDTQSLFDNPVKYLDTFYPKKLRVKIDL